MVVWFVRQRWFITDGGLVCQAEVVYNRWWFGLSGEVVYNRWWFGLSGEVVYNRWWFGLSGGGGL